MPQKTGQQGRPTRTAVAVTTQCLKETKDAVKLAVTSAAESVYQQLSEWAVLAEVALVMVPGSVEAERMFSTMSFLKDKVRNRLTTHLGPCARIYSQSTYSLANFPYEEALKHWHAAAEIRGRYGLSSNTY